MKILRTNFKLEKRKGVPYSATVLGINLAPFDAAGVGNVCPHVDSSASCVDHCVLFHVGHQVIPTVRAAHARLTRWLMRDRKSFLLALRDDFRAFAKLAKRRNRRAFGRPNAGSDLSWELIAPWIIAEARRLHISLYDYTKGLDRWMKQGTPSWRFGRAYQLTYSFWERTDIRKMLSGLDSGLNVAMVFDTRYWPQQQIHDALPTRITINGRVYRVIDGDRHDIRIRALDGHGVVVGLRFKGGKTRALDAVRKGFCVQARGGWSSGTGIDSKWADTISAN